MKYLCLMFSDEKACNSMPQNEQEACLKEHQGYDDELRRSGHLLVTEALQSVRAAATVRVRNGKLSVTDGPYVETKEQLGGFYLIEAHDLNDAIRVASKNPSARIGSIELRPIMDRNPQ